jgi:biotin transport system substrate-specific component
MALVSLAAVLTAAGGKISVPLPFGPVPMTLQTAVVLGSGVLLGARRGAAAMTLYMLLGIVGLPVFANGGGIQSVLSPSFGFVIGFIPAAWLTGRIFEVSVQQAERLGRAARAELAARAVSCLAGMAVYDAIGVLGLYLNINYVMGHATGLHGAVTMGLLPFILPDLLKIGAVVAVSSILSRRTRPPG